MIGSLELIYCGAEPSSVTLAGCRLHDEQKKPQASTSNTVDETKNGSHDPVLRTMNSASSGEITPGRLATLSHIHSFCERRHIIEAVRDSHRVTRCIRPGSRHHVHIRAIDVESRKKAIGHKRKPKGRIECLHFLMLDPRPPRSHVTPGVMQVSSDSGRYMNP